MKGMQYRAIGCSVALLLGIVNFINSSFELVELPFQPKNYILLLLFIFYFLGIWIVDSNKDRLEKYDIIGGKEQVTHVLIALGSIPLIIWLFSN
jgi:hypothetical protein